MGLDPRGLAAFAIAAALCAGHAAAWAQEPEEEDDGALAPEGIEAGGFAEYEKAGRADRIVPEYGVGLRLRGVFVPKGLLELFVEEASSGVFHPGFGLELNRRKGDFELVLGLEYEKVSPKDGYWLEKGDDPEVPGQAPDLVEFEGLSWFTVDLTFAFRSDINEQLSFRYGAGFGLGLVFGEAYQTDSVCTGRNIQEDCTPITGGGGQIRDPAGIPPVFPVVNLLAGLQYRPTEKMTVNLEAGMRTLFFFGLSSSYYF
jgi:opacity protein-like surface antigen